MSSLKSAFNLSSSQRTVVDIAADQEHAATAVLSQEPVDSRRFYYGWVMLAVSIVVLAASSPGQTYGVSIFNEPMRTALGLSHTQLASAYMFGTFLAAIPIIWIGGYMDRRGLRRTLLLVTFAFSASCILIAQSTGWWTVLAAFFLLRLLGPGAMSFVSGNILAFWFHRRLGLVEGIRQLGAAGAMATIPALNLLLVRQFGWRGAYMLLGCGVAAVLVPIAIWVFRNGPGSVGQQMDGLPRPSEQTVHSQLTASTHAGFTLSQTLRMTTFWIVASGTAWFGLAQTAVFFSMVPLFSDRGLSEADAARMMATFAVSLAIMHVLAGWLADHWTARTLLAAGMASLGLSMYCLYLMQTPLTGNVCGALLGFAQGVFLGASHPLWARYFGRKHLGRIRGALMTINIAASSLGPFIAGVIRDQTGSFDGALMLFALVPLFLSVACLYVRPPEIKPAEESLMT